MWAHIKKTLNSTLGTDAFQPLDEIIKGQRGFAASDSTIAVITNTENSGGQYTAKFIPKTNGVIRVTATARNSAEIAEKVITISGAGAGKIYITFPPDEGKITKYIDIYVSQGQEITFSASTSYFTVYSIFVGAVIVDNSLFDIES